MYTEEQIQTLVSLKKRQVSNLSEEELKSELVAIYEQMLQRDREAIDEIGRKWGIHD